MQAMFLVIALCTLLQALYKMSSTKCRDAAAGMSWSSPVTETSRAETFGTK